MSKATGAEGAAYRILRQLGFEVVRQFPIATGRHWYFADLYVPAFRLIVEIDGGYHGTQRQKRNDRNRSANIRRLGYHVCRLSNREARSPSKVKAKMLVMIRRISRTSSHG